ncbi:hypothetical protein Glove_521g22 [Diversispora epigaea]|uniref:Uncharacterized protein n=1 Tax=Diversispora epigaea TaxID=1348612 RepID=A0A397GJ18_9GLOM|nr:hypothetical protein Glove_521g22 [Diversispora epigaea]
MDMRVTDESLDVVRKDIENASNMLQIACLALRSCFANNSSSVKSFVELRTEITNEARVYSHKILPFANAVIRQIQRFCENYRTFTFDEFKEYLPDLVDESNKNAEICLYTLELHKAILIDFKKKQDKVNTVLKQMSLEAEEFEKRKNELLKSATVQYSFAIGLCFIPLVSAFVSPVLFAGGCKDIARATAATEEGILAVAGIDAIKNSLSVSLDGFVKSISDIAGFFKNLNNDLIMIAEDHRDEPKRIHYMRIKKKALHIIEDCRLYLSKIPNSEADLLAIPENFDKNYVQEWLSKREAEIDNEMITFTDWGRKLFTSNKNLISIITTESDSLLKMETEINDDEVISFGIISIKIPYFLSKKKLKLIM